MAYARWRTVPGREAGGIVVHGLAVVDIFVGRVGRVGGGVVVAVVTIVVIGICIHIPLRITFSIAIGLYNIHTFRCTADGCCVRNAASTAQGARARW